MKMARGSHWLSGWHRRDGHWHGATVAAPRPSPGPGIVMPGHAMMMPRQPATVTVTPDPPGRAIMACHDDSAAGPGPAGDPAPTPGPVPSQCPDSNFAADTVTGRADSQAA